MAGAPAASGPDPAELEESLVRADVSAAIAARVCEGLSARARALKSDLPHALAAALEELLPVVPAPWTRGHGPETILVVGVNGSGKTTTCAKLAHRAAREGLKPLLCAADTVRAAGSDQLRIWAGRLGCEVVAGATGADPAAVAYDALGAAVARGSDLLIVDTEDAKLLEEVHEFLRVIARGEAEKHRIKFRSVPSEQAMRPIV